MKLSFLNTLPESSNFQLFVTTLFEDERPPGGLCGLIDWHLNGRISRFLLDDAFKGKFGEKLLFNGAPRLPWNRYLLIGMGNKQEITPEKYTEISKLIISSILDLKWQPVCCQVPGFHRLNFGFSKAFEIFLSIIEQSASKIPELNIIYIEDLIEH